MGRTKLIGRCTHARSRGQLGVGGRTRRISIPASILAPSRPFARMMQALGNNREGRRAAGFAVTIVLQSHHMGRTWIRWIRQGDVDSNLTQLKTCIQKSLSPVKHQRDSLVSRDHLRTHSRNCSVSGTRPRTSFIYTTKRLHQSKPLAGCHPDLGL